MTKSKRRKAPITEIDLDGKQVHFNIGSRYGDQVSSKSKSKSSKASTMKELPSFLGDGGSDEDIRRVPSQYRPSLVVLDTSNLQVLLSTPVKVMLPLAEVLRVKPELWHEVIKFLTKMGINKPYQIPIEEMLKETTGKRAKCEPLPINKVGEYCEGEDGNTTLPLEFNEVKSLAILDSGAGVVIATKEVWESWGKLALRKKRMKL